MPGGYLIFVFLPIVNSYYCIIRGYLIFVFLPFFNSYDCMISTINSYCYIIAIVTINAGI